MNQNSSASIYTSIRLRKKTKISFDDVLLRLKKKGIYYSADSLIDVMIREYRKNQFSR